MGKGNYGYPGINKASKRGVPMRSLDDNVSNLKGKFKPDSNGYIGVKAPRKTDPSYRNFYAENPVSAAKDLFNTLGKGGVQKERYDSKGNFIGWTRRMMDESYVTYRPLKSSDKSPVVDIKTKTKDGKIVEQKIHFYRPEVRK